MTPTPIETVTIGKRLPDGTVASDPLQLRWYAIQTKLNMERQTVKDLEMCSIETFYPTISETRQWTDRRQKIDVSLFPQYLFVRLDGSAEDRVTVLRSQRVVRILGNPPEPVPDEQIDWVRRVVESGLECLSLPLYTLGQKVRVTEGSFKDIEGLLVEIKSQHRLAVQVPLLGRSVLVQMSARHVEAVAPRKTGVAATAADATGGAARGSHGTGTGAGAGAGAGARIGTGTGAGTGTGTGTGMGTGMGARR